MKVSVLLPLYVNDRKSYVKQSIDSMLSQTYMPSEILLFLDGKIQEDVQELIDAYCLQWSSLFKVVQFKENRGLGEVLKKGVEMCQFDYIARMDADDIAREDRLEKQVKYLLENPDVDLVGSYISEFVDHPGNIVSTRTVPHLHDQIKQFAKKRNPFNHMSVMFKKKSILQAGNYADFKNLEDYYLWIRLLKGGFMTHNIPEPLVFVRVGRNLYKRRGGIAYLTNEWKLQYFALRLGFINGVEFMGNIVTRSIVRVCPNFLREKIYLKFLRG